MSVFRLSVPPETSIVHPYLTSPPTNGLPSTITVPVAAPVGGGGGGCDADPKSRISPKTPRKTLDVFVAIPIGGGQQPATPGNGFCPVSLNRIVGVLSVTDSPRKSSESLA